MSNRKPDEMEQSQLDKFKQAARELETDDDPERFKDRLKKLVKHKPAKAAASYMANPDGLTKQEVEPKPSK